jgi:hypothetical protein
MDAHTHSHTHTHTDTHITTKQSKVRSTTAINTLCQSGLLNKLQPRAACQYSEHTDMHTCIHSPYAACFRTDGANDTRGLATNRIPSRHALLSVRHPSQAVRPGRAGSRSGGPGRAEVGLWALRAHRGTGRAVSTTGTEFLRRCGCAEGTGQTGRAHCADGTWGAVRARGGARRAGFGCGRGVGPCRAPDHGGGSRALEAVCAGSARLLK